MEIEFDPAYESIKPVSISSVEGPMTITFKRDMGDGTLTLMFVQFWKTMMKARELRMFGPLAQAGVQNFGRTRVINDEFGRLLLELSPIDLLSVSHFFGIAYPDSSIAAHRRWLFETFGGQGRSEVEQAMKIALGAVLDKPAVGEDAFFKANQLAEYPAEIADWRGLD